MRKRSRQEARHTDGRDNEQARQERMRTEEIGQEYTPQQRGRDDEQGAATSSAEAGDSTPNQRPKRRNVMQGSGYVFTRAYRKRKRHEGHMLQNRQTGGALKKRLIEVGPATVERTAQGKYDWADGALKRRRGTDEADCEGERRLRPRDPG